MKSFIEGTPKLLFHSAGRINWAGGAAHIKLINPEESVRRQDSSYISESVIDGNEDGGVAILRYLENYAILCGFTITNGESQASRDK